MNSLSQFLDDYPGMSTSPCLDAGVRLQGKFRFKANVSGSDEIEDSYKLEIIVPDKFPQAFPKVKETDGKILRIPIHSGHLFRFIPDSDSNPFRTPIPIHSGHLFQSNPDSSFGLFGLSDLKASEASG